MLPFSLVAQAWVFLLTMFLKQLYMFSCQQECSSLTPQEIVQKLRRKDGLVQNIISSLSDQYKKQVIVIGLNVHLYGESET